MEPAAATFPVPARAAPPRAACPAPPERKGRLFGCRTEQAATSLPAAAMACEARGAARGARAARELGAQRAAARCPRPAASRILSSNCSAAAGTGALLLRALVAVAVAAAVVRGSASSMTVTLTSGKAHFADEANTPTTTYCSYESYMVANNGLITRPAFASLTAGAGLLSLAPGQASVVPVGSLGLLAPGSSALVYFYVCAASVPRSADVAGTLMTARVYDYVPTGPADASAVASTNNTISVSPAQGAAANKIKSIVASTSTPFFGQPFTITIDGDDPRSSL